MAIRAVGFDLDATLVVTDRDRSTLLEEAVDAVGVPPIHRDDYLRVHHRHLTADSREPIFTELLDGHHEGAAGSLASAYRTRIHEAMRPIPGVERLLETLRSGYRVGLLTNGPTVAQREKLERLGWAEGTTFDAIAISGELEAGKPDERAFIALLSALETTPEETVFVGDNVLSDVRGAKAAGLRAIQVLHEGGADPEPVADAHLDRERLVAELPALLRELETSWG